MSSERDGLAVLGATRTTEDASGSRLAIRPLGLSDLASIREASLDFYKRQRIRTWTQNADELPEQIRYEMIKDAFVRAEELTYEQLPEKQVIEYENDSDAYQLTLEDRIVKEVHNVEYCFWWIASEVKGMVHALWLSARKDDPNISIDEIEKRFMSDGSIDSSALEAAAQKVGEITQPAVMGNGEAPQKAGRKRKKRKKQQTGR